MDELISSIEASSNNSGNVRDGSDDVGDEKSTLSSLLGSGELGGILVDFQAGKAGRIERSKSLKFADQNKLSENVGGNKRVALIRDTPFLIKSIDTKDDGAFGVINDFNNNELMYIMGGSDDKQTYCVQLTGDNYDEVVRRGPEIDLNDCKLRNAANIMSILSGNNIIIINTHEQKVDDSKNDAKDANEITNINGQNGLGFNVYDLKENSWLFKGGLNNAINFEKQFNSSHARALMFQGKYLVVSYREYLHVYCFSYLKKPQLIETFNLKQDFGLNNASYTEHGMLCIEKKGDHMKLLLFGGRSNKFLQSISEIILCVNDKNICIKHAKQLKLSNQVKMSEDRCVDNFCFHCILNKSERMIVILNGSSQNGDIICFNYDKKTLNFRVGDLVPTKWTFSTNASSIICKNSNYMDLLYLYDHYKISLNVIRGYIDGSIKMENKKE